MTRRKKLTIFVVAILALAAAGVVAFVAVAALREPSWRSKLAQLREGMTYDEVVAILGEPDALRPGLVGDPAAGESAFWIRPDWVIAITFDPHQKRVATTA